jgi:hypothetical protein
MKGFVKYHTAVTTVQLGLLTLSLCVASLGVVFEHPYLIYFWYLSLLCIAMILATSLLIAVALFLIRIFKPVYVQNYRWLSAPNSIRT